MKRLFWDIETSPNVGLFFTAGFDQNINYDAILIERKIICIGYKFAGHKVKVLRWEPNRKKGPYQQSDEKLIREFAEVAQSADELVAHYGDRFDMPWFRTRCLLHGLVIPQHKTVDTKAWASKNFYFNSNKLDYLAKVMGFGGKLATDFELWKRIMNNEQEALDYMCTYCGVDVERLEQVYNELAKYVKPKSHAGVMAGHQRWSCPKCASNKVGTEKTRISAAGTVTKQMQCKKCGSYYVISAKEHSEFLMDKR